MADFGQTYPRDQEDSDGTSSWEGSDWNYDIEDDVYLELVSNAEDYLKGLPVPKPRASENDLDATGGKGTQPEACTTRVGERRETDTDGDEPSMAKKRARRDMRTHSSKTALVHHAACVDHYIPRHPEVPDRVRMIMEAMRRHFPRIRRLIAPRATGEQITRFHGGPHYTYLMKLCSEAEGLKESSKYAKSRMGDPRRYSGGRSGRLVELDSDTKLMDKSREAILRAAGAVCAAVDDALVKCGLRLYFLECRQSLHDCVLWSPEIVLGRTVNAFCCVRPPGHHAGPNESMGFCFLNNIGIGARHAQAQHSLRRVAVIDFDVHHGNGTNAAFRNRPHTFFASTHQGPCFYPYRDIPVDGINLANMVNVNLGCGAGSTNFRKAYTDVIIPRLEKFRPDIIFISAGFDAHVKDPIGGLRLVADDYHWVTEKICEVARTACNGRVVSALEGGYSLRGITASAIAHVKALSEASAAVRSSNENSQGAASALADRIQGSVKVRDRSRSPQNAQDGAALSPHSSQFSSGGSGTWSGRYATEPQGTGESGRPTENGVISVTSGTAETAPEIEAFGESLLAMHPVEPLAAADVALVVAVDPEGGACPSQDSPWIEQGEGDEIDGLLERLTIADERDASGGRGSTGGECAAT